MENTEVTKDHQKLDDLFEAFVLISRGEYVSLYDVKNQLTRYSPAAADLFGFPEYISYGAYDWSDYIHPEDRRRYETVMNALIEGKSLGYDISYRVKLKDGSYAFTRHIGAVIRNEEGKPEFIGGIIINEGLMETTDPITVLRNQYGFFQDIAAAIELKKNLVLLLTGIGKMSVINDEHGYGYGNKVLQHFGWFLQEHFGQDGNIYRMDGAKFAFLTESLSLETVAAKYEKMRRSLLGGMPVDNMRQVLVLNGGMVSYDGSNIDGQTVYACLNRAFNDSKTRRNGKLVNYGGAIGMTTRRSLEMIDEIRNCIVQNCKGFYLRYQPIVSAKNEKIVAAEALLCWHSEKFGDVMPDAYVPVLERDFLFEELGYWIFYRAMEDGLKCIEKNPDFTMNINISPAQLTDEFLVEELVKISDRLGFPLNNLCLELTASCRQIEPEVLKKIVFMLKEKKVRSLLDDFGAGIASLEFLQSLSPEYIKPERKYVTDIDYEKSHLQIIRHLTNMATELGSAVCVKGIATKKIRDIVREFPVKSLQGHFYSEPILAEELMQKYF